MVLREYQHTFLQTKPHAKRDQPLDLVSAQLHLHTAEAVVEEQQQRGLLAHVAAAAVLGDGRAQDLLEERGVVLWLLEEGLQARGKVTYEQGRL